MKKVFPIVGILAGVALIITGIVCLAGGMGGNASTASSAGYLYDSGYTTFGADFYTYVSNNAQEAASAARTAANNLASIARLLKNSLGILMLCTGLLSVCHFGRGLDAKAANNTASATQPIPENTEEKNDSAAESVAEETAQEIPAEN